MSDFAELLEELLPDDWETDADIYGSSFLLICPHGDTIEQDAPRCPDGDPNPLFALGVI